MSTRGRLAECRARRARCCERAYAQRARAASAPQVRKTTINMRGARTRDGDAIRAPYAVKDYVLRRVYVDRCRFIRAMRARAHAADTRYAACLSATCRSTGAFEYDVDGAAMREMRYFMLLILLRVVILLIQLPPSRRSIRRHADFAMPMLITTSFSDTRRATDVIDTRCESYFRYCHTPLIVAATCCRHACLRATEHYYFRWRLMLLPPCHFRFRYAMLIAALRRCQEHMPDTPY